MADEYGSVMDSFVANPNSLNRTDKAKKDLQNSFGSTMDMFINRQNQGFLGQVNQAVDVNPDKFAEQKKIAQQLGTIPAAVEALPVDAARASKIQTLQADTQAAPNLRQLYTSADFAKLAHDDSSMLSLIEKTIGGVTQYFMGMGPNQGFIGTIKAAPFVAAESLAGVKRAGYDIVEPWARLIAGPDNVFARSSKFSADQAKAFGEAAKSITKQDDSIVLGGIQAGGQSFLQSSKYLPLALFGGPAGAAAALTGFSLETFGTSYNKAADKGVSLLPRLGYATSDAVIEWATEKGPLGSLVREVKAGTPFFTAVIKNAWAENKGEQVATVLQDLNEWAVLNQDKPFSDYLKDRPAAAAQTAIAVLFGATGNVALSKGLEQIANHQQSTQDAMVERTMFEQLGTFVEQSKLKARDLGTFGQFIAANTDGTQAQDIFISAQTLEQSGVAEQLAEVLPSVAEQLPDALASNGYVRISTADYTAQVVGTPLNQSLVDHIKTDPNGYTFAESKEYETSFNQEMQAQLESKLNETALDSAFKESRDAVQDSFLQQLNSVQRFTPEVNSAYAGLLANFYAVTAAKLGMTPQELVNRYQLNVVGQNQMNAQFDQGDFFYQDGRLMGINVRSDTQAGVRYADEIISGKKTYESRDSDSLRPYVGERIAIVRTGEGTAKAIGEVTLGEPLVVNEEQFNAMREQHLVPAGSTFDVKPGGVKYLYPVETPVPYKSEKKVGKGVVSRKILEQATQVNNGPRGQIFFGKDITQQPSVLGLLENADLSTFLHESGHFFLQVQGDLAMRIQTRISAGEEISAGELSIVEDMGKLLDWFGIKADTDVSALDKWAQMTLDEQRNYHEKFARGFEAYAFEGNAPTLELQSLFQKFRSWLINVYRDLKALNVQLTDDVRAVMDRMVATSQEIEMAEAARNMGPLFNPQNGTDFIEDWRSYHDLANDATASAIDQLQAKSLRDMQWLSNAKNRMLKKLQREHDELRDEVRREVTSDVMSQPVYQLWQFLTARAGDEAIAGVTQLSPEDLSAYRGKLRTEVLKEMYADQPEVNWQKLTRLHMTSDKNGLHPEVVAELAGFESADQMVKTLLDTSTPEEVIGAKTDQRMLEEHGALADQNAIERAADAAIHNELRAKMLQAEARALEMAMDVRVESGRTNSKGSRLSYNVLPKVAREFAQRLVAKLKVRDIRPTQYAAAEVKAAKAAERAFAKNDLEGAAEQKRNQIINNYATRAAYDAQDEVRRSLTYLRKFDKKSPGLDADYYDQIAQILERFDLVAATSLREIDKRTSLANWLRAQEEAGYKPDIPPAIEAEAFRKSYKDMTLEELKGLRDTVQQIEHLGRLKQKLLTAHDQRQFDQIRDEMAYSILKNSKGRKADNRTPNTVLGEKLLGLKNFFASHIKAATWARMMDGGNDGGPVWEYLIRSANDAGNKEVAMRERATRELSALVAPVLEQGRMSKGIYFEGIKRTLNKEAILAIALNIGNESNAQRLMGGEGWTMSQLKPVLDTLSTADWNFVQGVWDYFESYRPQIGEKERRVYGKEPTWIDARALQVQSKDGDLLSLRGGYYPVKYDPRASERAESHSEAEDAKRMLQGAYTSATTRRSFTKERVEEVNGRPLMYSLDGIYNGINEVIHDLSWHEWLIDANRIVKNPKISEAMREAYGAEVHQQFKTWIKDVAEGDRGAQNAGEKTLAWIRQGVSVSGLGINVMSALLQPFGITQSMVRIGNKWVGKGVAKFIADPVGLNSAISEMSEFMRTRSLTQMRELAELRNRVKGQSETRRNIDGAMYALMLRAQQIVDLPTWWGAYEKAIAGGNDQNRSVALADQAVIDAQGSGTTKDLSAIERGGPAMKLFTVFYSFMNTSLNMGVSQTMTRDSKVKLAADYLLIYVVPVVLISLMKSAFTPGDSDDWDDPKKIALKLLKEEVSYLMGLFFGLREISGIVDAFQGKPSGEYRGPAGTRLLGDTLVLAKQVGQLELDDGLRKAVINVTGELLRLPSAQINRSITGTQALIEGETDNPAAIVFGYEEP